MKGDWRDWRPAIWLAMLGVAVMLLIAPFWYGAVFIGAALGVAIRIEQRRRRIAAAAASAKVERRSSKQKRKRR
jgi:hypothetical protein